jgi:hypothetical protein
MISPRFYHAVAHVSNFIYTIGGVNERSKAALTCDRYDIFADEWWELSESATFDEFSVKV